MRLELERGLELFFSKFWKQTIIHLVFWAKNRHCLLVTAMTTSRGLVRLGKKLCLFVYYVEQINNKQWMAKKATTVNGGVKSRMVHNNVKRRI
jgi:hypothetical protein